MSNKIETAIEKLTDAAQNKRALKVILQRAKLNTLARKHPAEVTEHLAQQIRTLLAGKNPEPYIQETVKKSALLIEEAVYEEHLRETTVGNKSPLTLELEKQLTDPDGNPDYSTITALITYLIVVAELGDQLEETPSSEEETEPSLEEAPSTNTSE